MLHFICSRRKSITPRAERLANMVECADLSIAGRGLELSYRLDKSFDDRQNLTIDTVDIRLLIASLPDHRPEPINITPQ